MGRMPLLFALLVLSFYALPSNTTVIAGKPDTKAEPVWMIVKGEGHILEIAQNNTVKLDGTGRLKFKHEGRFIEVPSDFTVTVNGLPVSVDRAIHKGESVQIIDRNRATVWELSF